MDPASEPRADRSELLAGIKQGVLLATAILVLTLPPPGRSIGRQLVPVGVAAVRERGFRPADFGSHPASADARFVADWVADSGNNRGLPFIILDKRDARVFVFAAGGRLIDTSPVLLGAAPGDDSVSGIGTRPMAQVRPEEKTTPAGRFVAAAGQNAAHEDVVWVDYADAVSMHRVRPVDPKERRLERLASPDPAERRISYGCINVPVAFFEAVVWPLLTTSRAVVYVLPEVHDVHQVFAGAYSAGTKTARHDADVARL
ncbi:MAG TPA: hypothetical protein VH041_02495 [Caldimonas sp.]|jgi:hypothetical protein|nr:hypothetical protein [Caldimonas sp.]HEX4233150.1 hypothetical protein [Caldimonas sp.]